MAVAENGKQISLPETVFTFDCHPKERLIVSGLITGKIFLHMYSLETSEESRAEPPGVKLYKHKESCRTLKFSPKGNVIYSGSSDRSLVAIDLGVGSVVHQVKEAHTSPLYSMHVLSERLVTTGDDKGCIKLWDSRTFKCVMELKENDEFISDFASSIERNTLLATSGDGHMVAVDLRKKGMDEKSDQMESELLCVEVIKGGQKVVVGDGEGVLGLFHWGLWGDVTDRFPCQPQSIDSMVKITEDVVCTGCMDGSIRSCRLLPNQVLNQVGCHGNGLPVTNLSVTHNKDHVLSCSENVIKFWDLESVYRARCSSDGGVSKYISGEREAGDCSDFDSDEELPKKKKRKLKKNINHSTANQVHRKKTLDFFSDL